MKKILITVLSLTVIGGGIWAYGFFSYKPTDTKISLAADVMCAENNMIKSGIFGDDVHFTEDDFEKTLGVDKMQSICITSLPKESEGVLKLGDVRITEGDTIEKEDISSLTFTPATPVTAESSFTFRCKNYLGGAEMTCRIIMSETENHAPTVKEDTKLSVSTQKNISVYGTMTSNDPENDDVEYFIVSYPEKGTLNIMSKYGDFRYTPGKNYTGKDSFSYIARDSFGNFSDIATVSITVSKSRIDIRYQDMENCSAYNAALVMAENNIMIGELCGDGMYFNPNGTVSRGDFIVMVMKAKGVAVSENLTETFFDDNDKIDARIRPYVATAQKLGYVNGSFDEKGLNFRPSDPITRAEAAVIVSRMQSLAVPTVKTDFADSNDIPVWARDSVYATYEAGLMTRTETSGMKIGARENLSRAQAAEMFLAIMNIK